MINETFRLVMILEKKKWLIQEYHVSKLTEIAD